jgi:hypothetical protein
MALNKGIVVPVTLVSVSVIIGALWTIGPYFYEDRDYRGSIDSPEVRRTAASACKEMQQHLKAHGAAQATEAGEAMVARIRALGTETLRKDIPTEAWLDDWDRLLAAKRAGRPEPRVDGVRISRRMDDLVKDLQVCEVPPELLPPRI